MSANPQPCVCIARCNHCICGAMAPVGEYAWTQDAAGAWPLLPAQSFHVAIKLERRVVQRWRKFFVEEQDD